MCTNPCSAVSVLENAVDVQVCTFGISLAKLANNLVSAVDVVTLLDALLFSLLFGHHHNHPGSVCYPNCSSHNDILRAA